MRIESCAVAVCAAVCLHAGPALAQAEVRRITLAEVLTRARARSPQIVSARGAVEEARGRLAGASLRLQANPEVDASLGNRDGWQNRFTDVSVGVGQRFEPGARRAARMGVATAALTQSAAEADETTREVLRLAAAAFARALYVQERIALLVTTQGLATKVLSIAERRFAAGDIAILDVNIARASLARVRAAREAAEASRALVAGDLAALLGLDDDLRADGTFARGNEPDLPALLRAAAQRPDLRALEAGVREAEADVRLGRTFGRPEYELGVRYARDEGDQVVSGGVTIALPLFSRGQDLQAVGSARAARLRGELDAARARAAIEVRSAFEAYSRRVAAVRVLEADAIPGLDENDRLMTRSFDVGQIGLPDLLLIRREMLDTRSQYLDALLEVALARIELDANAGVLP